MRGSVLAELGQLCEGWGEVIIVSKNGRCNVSQQVEHTPVRGHQKRRTSTSKKRSTRTPPALLLLRPRRTVCDPYSSRHLRPPPPRLLLLGLLGLLPLRSWRTNPPSFASMWTLRLPSLPAAAGCSARPTASNRKPCAPFWECYFNDSFVPERITFLAKMILLSGTKLSRQVVVKHSPHHSSRV